MSLHAVARPRSFSHSMNLTAGRGLNDCYYSSSFDAVLLLVFEPVSLGARPHQKGFDRPYSLRWSSARQTGSEKGLKRRRRFRPHHELPRLLMGNLAISTNIRAILIPEVGCSPPSRKPCGDH